MFCVLTLLKLALSSQPDLARSKNPMEPPWFLQITGVKLYTKIMRNRAFLRAKDHRTSLPGPYSIIQYRIRGMRVRSFH